MWNDRWVPILAVPLNIGLSILFIHLFGLPGVFLGTAVATLPAVIVTPYILHKHYFKKSIKSHYLHFALFTLISAVAATGAYLLCSLLPLGFLFICVRLAICCAIVGIVYLVAYGWTKEVRGLASYAKRLILKNKPQ